MKNKLFLITISLLLSSATLNAMDRHQIPLDEFKTTDIEIGEPVSLDQLKRAIIDNNSTLAIQLLNKAQLQYNAEYTTINFEFWIKPLSNSNIESLKKSNRSSLINVFVRLGGSLLLFGIGIIFIAKAMAQSNLKFGYFIPALLCPGIGFTCLLLAFEAATKYVNTLHKIKLAQNSADAVKQIMLELRKIKILNKRAQLKKDQEYIEKEEQELEKLTNTAH